MASPGLGYKSYFQFGRESTWNTAATVNKRLPMLPGAQPRAEHGRIISPALDGKMNPVNIYVGGKRSRLTVEFELTYTGFLLMLDGMMGTATYGSNGGSTSGVNPYTHTFRQKEFLNSYTLELGMGDIPTGKVERILGAKIAEASFRCTGSLDSQDAIVTARLTFVGGTYAANVSATGSLSAATPDPVIYAHCSTDTDGSGDSSSDVELLGFELTIRNKLRDGFILDSTGSGVTNEPIRSGKTEITLQLTQEFRTKTALDSFWLTYAAAAPSLVFTSGSKTITFTLPSAFLTTHPEHDPASDEIMVQTLNWRGLDDGSNNSALTVIVVNAQSSITA